MTNFFDNVYKCLGCWEWLGKKNKKGYGVYDGKLAYVVSWEMHKGITDRFVCHTCDSRGCVNPTHLYLSDVEIDTVEAGTRDNSGGWKLSTQDVIHIREMIAKGASRQDMAILYQVTHGTITRNLKRTQDC